jgi:hypothetical protein
VRRATTSHGRAAVLAALTIVASVASSHAADLRCEYTSKIECTASGCAAAPVAGGYLLMPDAATLIAATQRAADAASLPTIQLCDGKGCTPIAVRAVPGGAFVNIAQDGGAHFVKVAMRDIPPGIHRGDFLEVAARLLTTATYVGSCPALVRPAAGK